MTVFLSIFNKVVDNAPYHGSSDVPKSRDKKQVMYDWVAENLPLIDRRALEPIENYRKPEIWDIVKQLKGSKNFYKIDKLAELKGHRVLRFVLKQCFVPWNSIFV